MTNSGAHCFLSPVPHDAQVIQLIKQTGFCLYVNLFIHPARAAQGPSAFGGSARGAKSCFRALTLATAQRYSSPSMTQT